MCIRDRNYNNSAGALPQLIQLSIRGKPWKKRSREGMQKLYKLLAHEVAHLWNSQLYQHNDHGGHAWMHEGGADAFAFRALRDVGIVTDEELSALEDQSFKLCKQKLKNYPLKDSAVRREFKNYYYCGEFIARVTEVITGDSLYAFWKKLFARADKNGSYKSNDYFDLLDKNSKRQDIIRLLRKLVYGPVENTNRLLDKIYALII